jgi:hypothetical protein
MAKINSLSDESLNELKRELQQLRNDTSNLRRHLAHVSARHREAVWVPPTGVNVLSYRDGFLAGGYSGDLYRYWPDVSGSGLTPCLAFNEYIGESSVGWTHDNTEAAPFTNGNFTVATAGVYVVWLTIRTTPKIDSTPTGRETNSFGVTPFRKRSGSWAELHRGVDFTWFLDWTGGYSTTTASAYGSYSATMTMPLQVGDKVAFRTAYYARTNSNIRAELSQATLQVARVSDTATDWTTF